MILGGDSGASLRDLLAAAALLKSKRVPPKLDLLVAPPSRQALEVLAQSGALVDLVATGARLLEPDPRLVTGELYPPPNDGGVSLRTFDPEPSFPRSAQHFVVASAETLAFSVATGTVGDPRSFKRPVRVTVPRTLPTDDVLIVRKAKTKSKEAEGQKQAAIEPPKAHPFLEAQTLPVVSQRGKPAAPSVLVLDSLDDVRWFARRAPELNDTVRAIVAPYIPSGIVPMLAGLGILAMVCDESDIGKLRGEATLALPAPSAFSGDGQVTLGTSAGAVVLKWVALGNERDWTSAGSARSPKR